MSDTCRSVALPVVPPRPTSAGTTASATQRRAKPGRRKATPLRTPYAISPDAMTGPTTDTITSQSTRTVRRRGQYRYARRPGRVKLRVLDGPRAGVEAVIERTRIRVGRGKSADVRVLHESLSGLHFELRLGRTGVEIFDLNSKNGTFLLGRRVYHAELRPGDEILAGECRIVLVETSDIEVEQGVELRDDGLLGISPPILEAFALLEKVARSDMHVLITGETGVGKGLFAKALHRHSARKEKPLVEIKCAALVEALADSTLFGHRRGAFTDAEHDRMGAFERASEGILVLDEVGELPLSVQAKLLQVLESNEIMRLGDSEPRKVNVRVIATSHRDLSSMVDAGTFRDDLYFRLVKLTIDVPNLRSRGSEDIAYLAQQFLAEANSVAGTSLTLGADAVEALQSHGWPGNVRELRTVMSRIPALCSRPEIQAQDLALVSYKPQTTSLDEILRTGTLREIHNKLDMRLLPRILKECDGNISKAARRLGVGRKALTNRIHELGLECD